MIGFRHGTNWHHFAHRPSCNCHFNFSVRKNTCSSQERLRENVEVARGWAVVASGTVLMADSCPVVTGIVCPDWATMPGGWPGSRFWHGRCAVFLVAARACVFSLLPTLTLRE